MSKRISGVLSEKQQQILDYLKTSIVSRGYPPSVREICDAVGLKSTSSVHAHLETLEKDGYIRRDATKPRAIEICDESFRTIRADVVSVPIVSKVTAGEPLFAPENIHSYLPLPSGDAPKGQCFALRVHGSSMIKAGIFNDDYIFVSVCSTAENGAIVVAMIGDSATVKRFYKEDGRIRLQPENDEMDPILVDSCTILGKVFGVYRIMK
ncbi:MAG: transcriptional repressor LexA [Lachnospiraceae bacterium]